MEPLPFLIPLTGDLLIGTAAALFLLITRRIASISGLVAAATRIADSGPPWWHAAAFVAGLPLGAWLVSAFLRAPGMGVISPIPLRLVHSLEHLMLRINASPFDTE